MSTSIAPEQYTMKLEGVEKSILSYMNRERKQSGQTSCEILLLANGIKHFYAHKIVLVSYSEFFRRYLEEYPAKESEKDSEKCRSDDEIVSLKSNEASSESSEHVKPPATKHITISLPGIYPEELDPVLEYMYTSSLALRAENVNEILLVGCLLEITSVIEFCAEVLLKKPSWKSPMVSPRIVNFVKRRDNDTSTAVTWAENGGRSVPRELRTARKYVRTSRAGEPYAHNTDHVFQRRQFQTGSRDSRNRYATSLPFEGQNNNRCGNKKRNTQNRFAGSQDISRNHPSEEQNQEFPMAIDPEELSRELTINAQLLRSRKHRSSVAQMQQQFSPTVYALPSYQPVQPTSVDARSYSLSGGEPSESSILSPGSVYSIRSVSPPARTPESSRHYDYEISDSSPTDHSMRNSAENRQPATMFPQINDCHRIWQAACASVLGFPMLQPRHPGLAFLNPAGRFGYPQAVVGQNGGERPEGHVRSPRADHTRRNRYPISADAMDTVRPCSLLEYDENQRFKINLPDLKARVTEPRQTFAIQTVAQNTIAMKGGGRESLHAKEILHRVPKRFCPNVIQHQDAVSANECRVSEKAMQAALSEALSPNQDGGCGVSGAISSSGICFSRTSLEGRKTEPCDASSSSDIVLGCGVTKRRFHPPSLFQYPTKKRKLLRAAPDQLSIGKKDCEIPRSNRFTPEKLVLVTNNRGSQCSSEDDIIARECHQVDGSDLDSDDSGRPSSV